ncbi:MAG: hypothetical protein EZS28_044358 [Streblomastix strix]|uniref:Uncharacterized protein n=1 Tax=Streblomastix strix TaxID=222440 RepID=A0A5J4TRY1_9EUKA|nr:MAG: hypothetical protein EZS28_044358 [Streblomastix strix]
MIHQSDEKISKCGSKSLGDLIEENPEICNSLLTSGFIQITNHTLSLEPLEALIPILEYLKQNEDQTLKDKAKRILHILAGEGIGKSQHSIRNDDELSHEREENDKLREQIKRNEEEIARKNEQIQKIFEEKERETKRADEIMELARLTSQQKRELEKKQGNQLTQEILREFEKRLSIPLQGTEEQMQQEMENQQDGCDSLYEQIKDIKDGRLLRLFLLILQNNNSPISDLQPIPGLIRIINHPERQVASDAIGSLYNILLAGTHSTSRQNGVI